MEIEIKDINAFHGTMCDFDEFSTINCSPYGRYGGLTVYFSSDYFDAETYSYENHPDKTFSIEMLTESGLTDEEARSRFIQNNGKVFTVKLNPKKPLLLCNSYHPLAYLSLIDESCFDEEDPDAGLDEETYHTLDGFYSYLGDEFHEAFKDSIIDLEFSFAEGLKIARRAMESEAYFSMLRNLGYDLIIDNLVKDEFSHMDAMHPGVKHYGVLDASIIEVVDVDFH